MIKLQKIVNPAPSHTKKIIFSKKEDGYVVATDEDDVAIGYVTGTEMAEVLSLGDPAAAAKKYVDLAEFEKKEHDLYFTSMGGTVNLSPDNLYAVGLFSSYNGPSSSEELPSGAYHLTFTATTIGLKPYKMDDSPVKLVKPKGLKDTVFSFLNSSASGQRRHKKGVLLYGPPGNGKTSEVMEIFRAAKESDILVFLVDGRISLGGLESFREACQGRKVVFVLEEMTERLRQQSTESILSFLDGENSWNNSVTIATTNYPKDLPENIVDRPGRFDTFIEYGNPDKEAILELAASLGFDNTDGIDSLMGDKFSYDYVSHILHLAKNEEGPNRVRRALTKEGDKRRFFSSTFKQKIGFGD